MDRAPLTLNDCPPFPSVSPFLSLSPIPHFFSFPPSGLLISFILHFYKSTQKKYYSIDKKTIYSGTYFEAKKELNELLNRSVERRLIADVPVGSFLSGGLDSSIIAMLAKKQKEDLRTFSIGFDHLYFNESEFAEKMAKHIGTKHETIVFSQQEFKKNLTSFLDSIDEPFADSSAFAVFLLSKKTKAYSHSLTLSIFAILPQFSRGLPAYRHLKMPCKASRPRNSKRCRLSCGIK